LVSYPVPHSIPSLLLCTSIICLSWIGCLCFEKLGCFIFFLYLGIWSTSFREGVYRLFSLGFALIWHFETSLFCYCFFNKVVLYSLAVYCGNWFLRMWFSIFAFLLLLIFSHLCFCLFDNMFMLSSLCLCLWVLVLSGLCIFVFGEGASLYWLPVSLFSASKLVFFFFMFVQIVLWSSFAFYVVLSSRFLGQIVRSNGFGLGNGCNSWYCGL